MSLLALPAFPTDDPVVMILSWDPGGTVGWAAHKVGRDALEIGGWKFALSTRQVVWSYGQFKDASEWWMVDKMIEMTREAWTECDFDNGDLLAVVNEDFRLRQFSMDSNLLSPVRINSAYRYALRGAGIPMFLQQPSDALFTVTDERLRMWNVWDDKAPKVEVEHARDAQRHGILFARKYSSDQKIRRAVHAARVNSTDT